MQPLKIPQSPMIARNGMMASEWLVFINEFIRLCNMIITDDIINQALEAAIIASGFRYSTDVNYDETIQNVTMTTAAETQIETVALAIAQDVIIDHTAVVIQQDDQQQDNPYALISSIEQQLYDQQIWSLNS